MTLQPDAEFVCKPNAEIADWRSGAAVNNICRDVHETRSVKVGIPVFFTTAENVFANPVSSLGAPALAFLAGYGVEVVFRLLDGLADQFSPARK